MKKGIKIITTFIIALTLMLGINVYAENITAIGVPIHKTDEEGKPLEGAKFTLKDVNGKQAFESSYKEDGDYLIMHLDALTPDEIFDMLPEKYQEVVSDISSNGNLNDYTGDFYARDGMIDIFFPMYIEETTTPSGYEPKKIVVIAYLNIGFAGGRRGASDEYSLKVSTENEFYPAGYYEYDENEDYMKIFDKINYNWSTDNYSQQTFERYFEKSGMILDKVECNMEPYVTPTPTPTYYPTPTPTPVYDDAREDIEMRFDEDITNNLCILQIEDEKEKVKPIPVNPETYGSLAVAIILVLGTVTLMATRRLKKN